MTIYTILERLDKLEKILVNEAPVYSIKERVKILENQISNIANAIGMDL